MHSSILHKVRNFLCAIIYFSDTWRNPHSFSIPSRTQSRTRLYNAASICAQSWSATLPRDARRCRRYSRRTGPRRTVRRRLRRCCRHTRSSPSSAGRTPRARSASSTSEDRRGLITDRPCRGHSPGLRTTKNNIPMYMYTNNKRGHAVHCHIQLK